MRRFALLAIFVSLAGLLVWRWRAAQVAGERTEAPAAEIPKPEAAKPDTEPTPPAVAEAPAPPRKMPDGDSPRQSAKLAGPIAWLLCSQNADGSWGGADELFEGATYSKHAATCLALLALLGEGFTHLDKEQYEQGCVGEAMKQAYLWLAAKGPETPFDVALASLAWGEAYGMTNSQIFKEQADSGLKALLDFQSEDGSWGGDARTSSWAAMALKSAGISGLSVPETAASGASAWFAARLATDPKPEDAVAWLFMTKAAGDSSADTAKALLGARPPSWTQQDFGYWYHGSLAMFQLDGPGGPLFTKWGEGLKATLGEFQEENGAWTGSSRGTAAVVKNSMGQMTMEIWYRYAKVMDRKK
ncbi:MAG: hypothetical protein AAB074_23195 [Planctomycetota bacterium]